MYVLFNEESVIADVFSDDATTISVKVRSILEELRSSVKFERVGGVLSPTYLAASSSVSVTGFPPGS